tara:strand:+ start:84 stop:1661 length:1578 start_codon:yes stop_codon:yes gene_type:complete
MKYSLKTNISTIVLLFLSYSAIAQWTSNNGFAVSANPNFNIKSESINQIFFWNDSLIGCHGQSYINLGGAYASVAYYANLKRVNGVLNRSLLAPRVISTNQELHLANTLKIYPEIQIGLNEERVLGIFGNTGSYHFGCFKLGTSNYLWQVPDTNRILSKPEIVNGDTLIWIFNLKNNQAENVKKINLMSGDTIQIFPYSNISPPPVPNYQPSNPYFLGESGDSIYIGYLFSDPNSYDSIGIRLGIKKIRVYSKTNLTMLDSFDSKVLDLSLEMILNFSNEGKPQYTDRSYSLSQGSVNTALRTIKFTSWKRDTLQSINLYSQYFVNQNSGKVTLPSIKLTQQNGFTLIDIIHVYTNPFDPIFENFANRLIMFDNNFNKKYEIASTGFDISKYIMSEALIDENGAVYFIGQQNSTTEFFTLGKIGSSGNHPWFKNFVNQEELALDRIINLYPNPSIGKLTLESRNSGFEYLTVTLFDIKGKFIEGNIKPDFNGSFSLPERLSNGMYYLKVQGREQSIQTFKVLLNR